jgi:DUF1680 family protein
MIYWNHRLNLLHGDSKYADIVEKELYNGALAGVSLQGDNFFYVNPLESDGTHHRVEWFYCSCCPTQIARFIPSIGNYVYASSKEGIWVNLYMAGEATIPMRGGEVKLSQTANYPWDGKINITVEPTETSNFEVNLRFPGWCKSAKVIVNGFAIENPIVQKGYIKLVQDWKIGDMITLEFDMPVERVYSHPKVKDNVGKVAVQRGPLVYCVEEVDNGVDFDSLCLPLEAKFLTEYKSDLLDGVSVISVTGQSIKESITFIPYYAWDNREPGKMKVWLSE